MSEATIKEFKLVRLNYDDKGTPGEFQLGGILGGKLFSTLERPRNGNKKDDPQTKENESSCIPEGRYLCRKYSSPKYPDTWEIQGVASRTRILFHIGNCIADLLGCIAIGEKFAYNIKHFKTGILYKYWLMSSTKGFKRFQEFMPDKFYLTITSKETQELHANQNIKPLKDMAKKG